jgi:hypothetical protein
MDFKTFIKATIISTIFIFCYEWALNCIILKDAYMKTGHLWRESEDIKEFAVLTLISQLLMAGAFVILFEMIHNKKAVLQGVASGAILGLFLGAVKIGSYAYITIPFSLAASWFSGVIIECAILGLILSLLVFKKK